jgi:beta-lactamase regulating signal transducer with metallopeptidase domain
MGVGFVAVDGVSRLSRIFTTVKPILHSSALLFSLRIFPFALASIVSFGFVLPAFLLLEPRQTTESPEPHLVMLAFLATTLIGIGIWRFARSISETRRVSRKWLQTAQRVSVPAPIPVYRVENPESLVAIVGFFRPRILVGRQAMDALSGEELRAAVAHELAHSRSVDNLKQLVLTITRAPRWFPQFASIEKAWSNAVEIAADQAALAGGISALELGSAIVKIGRLRSISPEAASIAACHLLPASDALTLAGRLGYLRQFLSERSVPPTRTSTAPAWLAAVLFMIGYLAVLPKALPMAHQIIEWLVR